MKPPKSYAPLWWSRGVLDGKAAARKRRGRFFALYLLKAGEALNPGELLGEFECVYRCAFRAGWDAEQAARVLRNTFSSQPRKCGSLHRS